MITRNPNELPTEAYRDLPLREQQMADAMMARIDEVRNEVNQCRLLNNMTNNYRAVESETLLFVNHEPRRLRPEQSFRGEVRWNESKDEHDIKSIPEDAHHPIASKDLDLQSQHVLCLPCRDLLHSFCQNNGVSNEELLAGANVVLWHESIASLVISAKLYNCCICNIILNKYLWTQFPSLLRSASGLANFHLEVCWDDDEGANGLKNFYFAVINSSKRKHTSQNYFFLGVMCAWPRDVALEYCNSYKQFEAENGGVDSEIERRKHLARFWTERCTNDVPGGHKTCALGDDNDFVPTRVLDVEASVQSGRLRLVCQEAGQNGRITDTRYCTLSHCWGKDGSQRIPLLRKDNIDYRCSSGLPMQELPPAFREAVAVCGWFQVKYIWIDSLCIIQDSKEDWQKEANLMSNIYKSAWLNISADAGEDSGAGLFQDTGSTDRTWPRFRTQGLDHDWTLTPSPDYFIRRIQETSSFPRAWIHRERQLSRRILHFTKYGMAWECCELGRPSYATESLPDGVPYEHFFEADNKYQIGRLEQELVPGDEETYARWNDICEILSTKNLTYESDRWLILSTMAEDFSKLLPDDKYMAGLWGSTLPHSLLWYHKYPRGKPTPRLGPSWSWLSACHPVTLANRARIKKHAVVADLLIAVATLMTPDTPSLPADRFGRVKQGALELRGYVRPIRLKLQHEEQTWELYVLEENLESKQQTPRQATDSSHSITKGMRRLFKSSNRETQPGNAEEIAIKPGLKAKAWRYIGKSRSPTEGDLCDLHPDEADVTVPYDCFAFFVTLNQYLSTDGFGMNRRQLECLILEKADQGRNLFRRYGQMLLYDELAVKMRYQVPNEKHFIAFDRRNVGQGASPQDHIAGVQLKQAQESGNDAEDDKTVSQGVDSLYQFDGDVQQAFPWLARLEPVVLQIV